MISIPAPLGSFDFGFQRDRKNELLCNPLSLEMFEPFRREYTLKLGVGELRVFSSAVCPPDEAWMFDHTGKLTRLVWGERHNRAAAICGPVCVDANGSPVEDA